MAIETNRCYRVSENVVARQIEGELIIVPLKAGIGDLDSEMYALGATGIDVWKKLNGDLSLAEVIETLSREYSAPHHEIEADVIELVNELMERGLVVAC